MASRYAKLPTELFDIDFYLYSKMLTAAGANHSDEQRHMMKAALLPFWVEHSKTLKMEFGTLCEKLALQRPATASSARGNKEVARLAIDRAKQIRQADLARQ